LCRALNHLQESFYRFLSLHLKFKVWSTQTGANDLNRRLDRAPASSTSCRAATRQPTCRRSSSPFGPPPATRPRARGHDEVPTLPQRKHPRAAHPKPVAARRLADRTPHAAIPAGDTRAPRLPRAPLLNSPPRAPRHALPYPCTRPRL
jgi:hypothetical protein